jgi:2-polyprenyl-6-methoxyphenol hydroxylase-like FAD-dependent oxidoreductase
MDKPFSHRDFAESPDGSSPLQLKDGSRVAVVGGGPAGSFFAYFLREMAERFDREIDIVIYESRDFSGVGPGRRGHQPPVDRRPARDRFLHAAHRRRIRAHRYPAQ